MDTAARFGGDEFALVLPETGDVPANLVAGRICDSLANDGRKPKLSVSIGIAIYPKNGPKVDSLLGAADAALYSMKAKTRGPGASAAELRRGAAVGGKTRRAANPPKRALTARQFSGWIQR